MEKPHNQVDVFTKMKNWVKTQIEKLKHASGDTIGWVAILLLHTATIPSMLGLMVGITDNTPPVDLTLLLWSALGLLFLKAIVQKDFLNLITIGLGFMGQAMILALIFFR